MFMGVVIAGISSLIVICVFGINLATLNLVLRILMMFINQFLNRKIQIRKDFLNSKCRKLRLRLLNCFDNYFFYCCYYININNVIR